MSAFDELLKNEDYRKLLDQLAPDERKPIEEALRKFVEDFENYLIKPLSNLRLK